MLAIEVNGFRFHDDNAEQMARDELKRSICDKAGIPLLTLRTTESDERRRIHHALRSALGVAAGRS